MFNFPFEVEHILPLARKGKDNESNMALACRSCNLYKATQIDGIDPQTRAQIRLFNPRTDEWQAHFVVNRSTGEISGASKVGRATVAALEMNSELQLLAWRQWMRLGLFPYKKPVLDSKPEISKLIDSLRKQGVKQKAIEKALAEARVVKRNKGYD